MNKFLNPSWSIPPNDPWARERERYLGSPNAIDLDRDRGIRLDAQVGSCARARWNNLGNAGAPEMVQYIS